MKKLTLPLVLALVAHALALAAISACYDATKVPPCTEGAVWPDTCASAPPDAGDQG